MIQTKETIHSCFSPIDLLYTAYSDDRPIVNNIIEKLFQKIDHLLDPLPLEDQDEVFNIFCETYLENEKQAFSTGVRVGALFASEVYGFL